MDEALLGAMRRCTDGLNAIGGNGSAIATLDDLHQVIEKVAAVIESEPDRPAAPGTYYLGYEHPAMKRMVETDLDAGRAKELGAELVELRAAVAAVVRLTPSAGLAGEAARAHLSRIGEWIASTGRAFDAAARARSEMPEPVDFSMNAAIGALERETDPITLRDTVDLINQRFEDKQRAHEQAAQVMTTFAEAIRDSGPEMPALAPVPITAGGG